MPGGGGGEQPSAPLNGGEFLLQLLKNPPHLPPQPPPQQSQVLSQDPTVADLGPRLAIPISPPIHHSNNGLTPPWIHHNTPPPPPPFAPHNFFVQNFNSTPNSNFNLASSSGVNCIPNSSSNSNFNPAGVNIRSHQNVQLGYNTKADDFVGKLGLLGPNHEQPSSTQQQQEQKDITFGSMMGNEYIRNGNASQNSLISQHCKGKMQMPTTRRTNGLEVENNQSPVDFDREGQSTGAVNYGRQGHNGHNNYKAAVPPPGKQMGGGNRESSNRRNFGKTGERGISSYVDFGRHGHKGQNKNHRERERRFELKNEINTGDISDDRRRISDQLDSPGPVPGSDFHSVSASDIEESMMELHDEDDGRRETMGIGLREKKRDDPKVQSDLDDLEEQLVDSLGLVDESGEGSNNKKSNGTRDKDYRSDKRGQSILGRGVRYMKRKMLCRADINRLDAPFVAIYESLIPPEEEKAKQKQILSLLEKVVSKEWPDARLYIYGSCANSFGFSKSDIDVCLTLDDLDASKSEVLLKLADMLQSENLQNVQAITRTRVPIVKLMDPATGISCDICVNNVLAVINTKLLQDYAQIDVRLRQLAFIVKHWAKSRGVNETYQGTLSSYAYVLMCIHFLQQRRPPILPCLQEMKTTHNVTVDNFVCAYFDQVEHLVGFGSNNRESIAQLVWSFFNYWAYHRDYVNDVISVRTGSTLSKRAKDWTRRIGNDRHLICIEDPFELTHDLGRVVDKRSIKVLREEFERAAEIMQYDFNPSVNLFEPYIPT